MPVLLYGSGTWSLTLRERCRLILFENRILRRIFEPESDGNGNEELHSLYHSPNIVRMIVRRLRWVRHVARMEEEDRSTFIILTNRHNGKRPLARLRHRWEDNITTDVK